MTRHKLKPIKMINYKNTDDLLLRVFGDLNFSDMPE